jgi:hypothetical protein
MEIIRDEMWNKCLGDATKMYRLAEPDDKCRHLANATWVMKKRYEQHAKKKSERTIMFIDTVPEEPRVQVKNSICTAMTMSGSRFKFKAVCGNYCRKHNVSDKLKSQLL